MNDVLFDADPDISNLINLESRRQKEKLQLIASENYVSAAILRAAGSILTNKYAEGYPGYRYYAGCEYCDEIEKLAVLRARQLFGAEHINVQPHSGANANLAVYMAVIKPGDTVLAMNLDHGGHITHGLKSNFSGSLYNIIPYGVNREDGLLDYDKIERLAYLNKPKLIIAGATAYSRIINFEKFSEIAKKCGAKLLVDMAHIAGLVAAGLHPSPIPYADFVTTTTHKTLRGPRGGMIICKEQYKKSIDASVFPGIQGGPLMHIIAAKAVCFLEALKPDFTTYQVQVLENSKALALALGIHGFNLVSGGTDNHLILIDLRNKNINGLQAQIVLNDAGIVVNKNKIPYDTEIARVASGIRLGTPAVTTRGFKQREMFLIANWISELIEHPDDCDLKSFISDQILHLTSSIKI